MVLSLREQVLLLKGPERNGVFFCYMLADHRYHWQLCRVGDAPHCRSCDWVENRRREVNGADANRGVYAYYPRGQLEARYPL